jgi:hypothetical protein
MEEQLFLYTYTNHLNFEGNILHHCSLAACILFLCAFDFCCVNMSVSCMNINSFKRVDISSLCAALITYLCQMLNGL